MRKQRLYELLSHTFQPMLLEIEDETYMHHVPSNSESHFKLLMVASSFDNMSRLTRQRQVMSLLKAEFNQGLHALSLQLYSPKEWSQNTGSLPSPACRGGKHHDKP